MDALTLESTVTLREAYLVMFDFLDKHWDRTGRPTDLGALLGDLSLGNTVEGKLPIDRAVFPDWLHSAKLVLEAEQTATGYQGADIVYEPQKSTEKEYKIWEHPDEWQQLIDEKRDVSIMRSGGVNLYHKEAILNYDIEILKRKRYKITEFEGSLMTDYEELSFYLQAKLLIPGYYGRNLDALDEALSDYTIEGSGWVLVFRHLDSLDRDSIERILNFFASHSRRKFAFGQKLMLLGQVDNPKFEIKEPIGSINFDLWNDKERYRY